jgi:hypothetical protein
LPNKSIHNSILGLFVPFCCVIQHRSDYKTIINIDKKLKEGEPFEKAFEGKTSDEKINQLRDWVTVKHEEIHFFHFLGSTFGRFMMKFLIQKLGFALIDFRRFYFKYLDEEKENIKIPIPLIYASINNYKWPSTEIKEKADDIVKRWGIIRLIDNVLFGEKILDDAVGLIDLFGQIYNKEVSGINKIYFGETRPTEYRFYSKKGTPTCPDPRITTIRLFEMNAFLCIVNMLRNLNLPQNIYVKMVEELSSNLYISAMDFANEYFSEDFSFDDYQFAADLALSTPIGLSGIPDKLYYSWESIHPGWRFYKIVEAMGKNNIRFQAGYSDYNAVANEVATYSNLPPMTVCNEMAITEDWQYNEAMVSDLVIKEKEKGHIVELSLFKYLFDISNNIFKCRYDKPDFSINFNPIYKNGSVEESWCNEIKAIKPVMRNSGGDLVLGLVYYSDEVSGEEDIQTAIDRFKHNLILNFFILLVCWEIIESRSFIDTYQFCELLGKMDLVTDENMIDELHKSLFKIATGIDRDHFIDFQKIDKECNYPDTLNFWLL